MKEYLSYQNGKDFSEKQPKSDFELIKEKLGKERAIQTIMTALALRNERAKGQKKEN